jgi:hypothetical protein
VEKVTGLEAEFALEESGKHHNLICIGVGISSPAAGRHCSTAWSRRKWFVTSLRISLSSMADA